jgi:hypothetical protein
MSPISTPTNILSTPTLTPEADTIPPMLIQEQMGRLYEVIMTIPLGKDGVSYRGVGSLNMEITGPNALAVLPNGNFVVADLIGKRLLLYDVSGHLLKAIDLNALGILNVSDLRATEAGLFILEVFLGPPQRYKVHHVSFKGDLIASYEIPKGFHLENGLSGIAIGSQSQIFLELEGGSKLYQLNEQPDIKPLRVAGYPFYGRDYEIHNPTIGESAVVKVDSLQVETTLSHGLGGFNFLTAFPDGSFYIIRDDIVNDQVIQLDQTVHYLAPDGVQLGVARVPLREYYYQVSRKLAVGPDGNVFALLPQPDSIKIIRLNFYKSLEPLIPTAVEPLVTIDR